MDFDIEEIIDFVIKEGNGIYSNIQREELKKEIIKHINYGTFLEIRNDENKIVACCRWNWIDEKRVWILDLVVRRKYRKPHFLREMLAVGLSKNPQCEFMGYERRFKYPDRIKRFYSVDRFLKRRK